MRCVPRRLLMLACAFTLLHVASSAFAQSGTSGAAYLDCRGKPRFKVGDWVKYRFSSHGDDGSKQDYDLTLLISGEELFWGEPCFWIETWTGLPGQKSGASDCKLMSYAMFGDTAWEQRLTVYERKFTGIGEMGDINQQLVHRTLSQRPSGKMSPVFTVLVDTLARDTAVTVPRGRFVSTKVRLKSGVGETRDIGDSTRRIESWDLRIRYMSPQVPITSIVKEITDQWQTRKKWKAGKSEEAIENYVLRGTATLDLVAFGHGGMEPELTPLAARKALAQRPAITARDRTPVKSPGAAPPSAPRR